MAQLKDALAPRIEVSGSRRVEATQAFCSSVDVVVDLSGKDKTMTCTSTGHRKSLYRANTQSN